MTNARGYFDQLARRYHQKKYLTSDPVQFPHQFSEALDQEAVGLVSALLAYGKASIVISSVSRVLEKIHTLSESPSDFIIRLRNQSFRDRAYRQFHDFKHRFNNGTDIVNLFYLLSISWKKFGSLQKHFEYHSTNDSSLEYALTQVVSDWKNWIQININLKKSDSINYFLTNPQDGSACKRWCMYLKWMIRPEFPDCGTWSQYKDHRFKSSDLILPIDTHVGRLSQYMGMTKQKTLNWKFANSVTLEFKKINPQDPTRYDFALSRLGILGICKKKYVKEICQKCEIFPLCGFAKKQKRRAS